MGTLLAIVQLIPAILKAVAAAEEFVPLPGAGKAKLDFVLGVLQDLHAEASTLIPQITAIVTRAVGLANAVGLFKSKA